jgi:DNA primase large subunit
MVKAAKAAFGKDWSQVSTFATSEFRKLAESLRMITRARRDGKMTKAEAKLHLNIQRNAARSVMLAIKGMALIEVEKAINAALRAVKTAVNKAIGFALV